VRVGLRTTMTTCGRRHETRERVFCTNKGAKELLVRRVHTAAHKKLGSV